MADTMRAVRLHEFGPADNLKIESVPVPEPGKGQVRVRQMATSVNRIDCRARGGYGRVMLAKKRGFSLPWTPGLDVAGIVDAIGPGVTQRRVGEAVFGAAQGRFQGTHAEYALAGADQLAAKPDAMSWQQAAAVPWALLAAWGGLVDGAGLTPGQASGKQVLVTAGSGGVGSMAIQLLAAWGATVHTTCPAQAMDTVAALGAPSVFDYQADDYTTQLTDIDVVLDCVGGAEEGRAASVLKPGGHYATLVHPILETFDAKGLLRGIFGVIGAKRAAVRRHAGVNVHWVVAKPNATALQHAAGLAEQGAFKPLIDHTGSLEDIVAAHRYVESGQATGKVVLMLGETTDNADSQDRQAEETHP